MSIDEARALLTDYARDGTMPSKRREALEALLALPPTPATPAPEQRRARPILNPEKCPEKWRHAPDLPGMHAGYIETDEWHESKGQAHDQQQCPACRLWVVWVPKAAAVKP